MFRTRCWSQLERGWAMASSKQTLSQGRTKHLREADGFHIISQGKIKVTQLVKGNLLLANHGVLSQIGCAQARPLKIPLFHCLTLSRQ